MKLLLNRISGVRVDRGELVAGRLAAIDASRRLRREPRRKVRTAERGFTLVDVVMSLVLAVLIFGGTIATYVQAGYRAERAGFSLAAQGLAIQQLEQARAAKWDILDTPNVDEFLTLNTNPEPAVLDMPVSGTNLFYATNRVKVSMVPISTTPVVNLHLVKVETIWSRYWMGKERLFTNTLCGYFAPDR